MLCVRIPAKLLSMYMPKDLENIYRDCGITNFHHVIIGTYSFLTGME